MNCSALHWCRSIPSLFKKREIWKRSGPKSYITTGFLSYIRKPNFLKQCLCPAQKNPHAAGENEAEIENESSIIMYKNI
jgi:hypothetical protein